MQVLTLDYYFGYDPATFARFGSSTSCFDFDLVIWDPASVIYSGLYSFGGLGGDREYRGLPNLDESSSVRLRADIGRRRTEFTEFVAAGRTLVVIVRPPQRFYYDTGERTYSGTGRNRRTTVHVAEDDVWRALPIDVTVTPAGGKNLQFVGPGAFAPIWRQFKEILRYEAVVSAPRLVPLFKVAGSDRVAGGTLTVKTEGRIILLPAPEFPDEDEGDLEDDGSRAISSSAIEGEPPLACKFQNAIEELAMSLAGSDIEALPEWVRQYALVGEVALQAAVVDKERQLKELRTELSESQAAVAKLERRKLLVTGSGRGLELEVRDALEALGGEVSEPEPGRDDWRVTFPEGNAVVEVKGLIKSAGEKDAAQLEKWVANHLEETGVEAKGILVANGWRDVPLDKRTEPVFPDQMLKYSKARGHCLVTGVQLLGIWQEVEARPDKAAAWRTKLLTTTGRLKTTAPWLGRVLSGPVNGVAEAE